jgi:hypothetical protein
LANKGDLFSATFGNRYYQIDETKGKAVYQAEMNAEAESESDDEPASAHQLPIPPAKQIEKGKQP